MEIHIYSSIFGNILDLGQIFLLEAEKLLAHFCQLIQLTRKTVNKENGLDLIIMEHHAVISFF